MSNNPVINDPYSREAQTFPTLQSEQVEICRNYGQLSDLEKHAVVFERGQRSVDFFVVVSGNIEIYEHRPEGTKVFTVHQVNQFTGEIDLFNNRKVLVGGRMGCAGQVIRIKRADFRKLIVAEPDLGEIIMQAFILRREGLVVHGQAAATIITHGYTADSVSIERFLRRNGYPVEVLDCADGGCSEDLRQHQLTPADLPAIVIHQTKTVLKRPSTYELADTLGLDENLDFTADFDVAIVGGGPAGLSAAVYAASEGLKTVLLEQEAPGGQASTSSKIENYLGFPMGLSGQDLANKAQIQAMKFGAHIVLPYTVSALDCTEQPYRLRLCNGDAVKTKAVIVASGAKYRRLNLDQPEQFDNAGVYYAATQMEGKICENEEIVVVGGGNSAGQAAVFLSKQAEHVHILVRGDALAASMSDYLIGRIEASPKITLHINTEIVALHGQQRLEGLTWQNNKTGAKSKQAIRHVFLMLGAIPNTDWIKDCIKLDEKGFIKTGLELGTEQAALFLETSQPGVYAAGDVRSNSIKRVASAVGEGAMSVSHVHQFLARV